MSAGTLNTALFTWIPDSRKFVAEASTLRHKHLHHDFALESERTGRVVELKLKDNEFDREGDLIAWNFVPVDQDLDFAVTVFND